MMGGSNFGSSRNECARRFRFRRGVGGEGGRVGESSRARWRTGRWLGGRAANVYDLLYTVVGILPPAKRPSRAFVRSGVPSTRLDGAHPVVTRFGRWHSPCPSILSRASCAVRLGSRGVWAEQVVHLFFADQKIYGLAWEAQDRTTHCALVPGVGRAVSAGRMLRCSLERGMSTVWDGA